MRNLILSMIFLGIVGYLGTILLYQRVALSEGQVGQGIKNEASDVVYSYPAHVKIKSADGRVIQVTLLARSATHIQFTREDGEEFVYLIDSLDANAQALVRRYPNVGIKNAATYVAQGSMSLDDVYVQELEKDIRQIDQKIENFSRELASSLSQTRRRTIQRMLEGLQAEKAELQRKILGRQ